MVYSADGACTFKGNAGLVWTFTCQSGYTSVTFNATAEAPPGEWGYCTALDYFKCFRCPRCLDCQLHLAPCLS